MRRIAALTLALTVAGVGTVDASSLRGSAASMVEQNRVAKDHGLSFFRTTEDIRNAVARGELVKLDGNENYAVADFVQLPYLHPAGKLFVERLSEQYREACGQKLVVTSAVRPANGQPTNAHRLSVHPAGMAVDLRVSDRASCRSWLEGALLNLNNRGVINGIREFRPPHYHVAIYPEQYLAYVEERTSVEAERQVEVAPAAAMLAEVVDELPAVANLMVAQPEPEEQPAASRTRSPAVAALVALLALPFGLGVLRRGRRTPEA
jgi:hypothetical protein